MGTSLSGLTPATTFDGLLKTSDNDALGATLKTIGTGDGTDSILQLSNSALQVNGPTTINGAQMTIIGAGSDALTTSLLVQNSLGADSFKVDDGGSATATSFKTTALTINSNQILGSSGIKLRNTTQANGGTSVSTADGAPANTMLYVKGFGATSGSTSLLVQNSAGDDILKVTDDGGAILKSFGAINTLVVDSSSGTSSLEMQSTGAQRFRIQASSTSTRFTPNNTGGLTFIGNGIFTGGAFDTAAARLHIKGSGNDNTTTSLLVQNSDASDLLKVTDNGAINITPNESLTNAVYIDNSTYGNANLGVNFRNGYGGAINFYNTGTIKSELLQTSAGEFRINTRSTNDIALRTNNAVRAIIHGGTTDPSMTILGRGATSATSALLVQNSDATDLLEVRDDGEIILKSFRFGATTSYTYSNQKMIVGSTGGPDSGVQFQVKGSGATSATTALLVQNSAGTDTFKVLDDGTLVAPNLPTSATGLPTGAIYNDAGTLKIV